jgi:hypothetical protein
MPPLSLIPAILQEIEEAIVLNYWRRMASKNCMQPGIPFFMSILDMRHL